jgi:hypothetical protein
MRREEWLGVSDCTEFARNDQRYLHFLRIWSASMAYVRGSITAPSVADALDFLVDAINTPQGNIKFADCDVWIPEVCVVSERVNDFETPGFMSLVSKSG